LTLPRESLESAVGSVAWFHSIDLGNGIVTPGIKSAAQLDHELRAFGIPDLTGRTVLDVGAWDGYFSFAAESRGARRVVALDHYVWSVDFPRYWAEVNEGAARRPYHETRHWQPETLPGKRGFDLARETLGSRVEPCVADFMTADLEKIGTFDVVFFLGVLYHLENPFAAIRRLSSVTRELAIIETEAIAIPGRERRAFWEFFPSDELDGDVTNWWAPNDRALEGMCLAAGFRRMDVIAGPPAGGKEAVQSADVIRYRAVVHAWK
jgi:tRNA (mo5U34)-methyltransferase